VVRLGRPPFPFSLDCIQGVLWNTRKVAGLCTTPKLTSPIFFHPIRVRLCDRRRSSQRQRRSLADIRYQSQVASGCPLHQAATGRHARVIGHHHHRCHAEGGARSSSTALSWRRPPPALSFPCSLTPITRNGKMLIQVNFEATGWWYAVELEEGEEINYRHDRLALATILRSVLAKMLAGLRDRRTSTVSA
jgi:hypothetical protein